MADQGSSTSDQGQPCGWDAERVLRRLWERMTGIYGHRWTSAYGDDVRLAGGDWALGLADLTLEQIARAVDLCRKGLGPSDGWPPTLPVFREMALGIPSFEAVRAELLRLDSAERSPFTVACGRMMDLWAWRRADADRADRMLRAAYERVREAVMAGHPLPKPEPQLPAPAQAPRTVTPTVGREHLARIASLYGDAA